MISPLRIQRQLLSIFIAVVIVVVAPVGWIFGHFLARDVRATVEESMSSQAFTLAAALEREKPIDVRAWVALVRAATPSRVTIITRDGVVIGDSDVADLGQLENHAHRPEVAAALAGRVGSATRMSVSMHDDMMYVAVPVGKPPASIVLRLSQPMRRFDKMIARATRTIFLCALLALALVLIVGTALARWMTSPILQMTIATRAMGRGDFSLPLPPPPENELGDLILTLETLRNQLALRIEELRSEGAKLQTILNTMTEGVALVHSGSIVVANPAFTRLLGVSQRAEGRSPIEITRLPALSEIVDTAVLRQEVATREVLVAGRSIRMQAQPLGRPLSQQAVIVLIDMTENKQVERLRRDFVANASHELRTPVAAILGAAETLAAGAADDPAARASFIDILNRHALRLSMLTSDLLDIARLEAGYKPRTEVVLVEVAAESVRAALQSRAEAKGLTLHVEVAKNLNVTAERAAVDQVLTNLVDNAIKYTPKGGVIWIRARTFGGKAEIVVEDTGPGIAAEHLPRLFERFYRVDNARSRELGGTGLGLAIVKHLLIAHAGDVQVDSTVGAGTRFVVTLLLATS